MRSRHDTALAGLDHCQGWGTDALRDWQLRRQAALEARTQLLWIEHEHHVTKLARIAADIEVWLANFADNTRRD